MRKTKSILELTLLKTMLAIYIMLAVVLAGLNYGYAGQASPSVKNLISGFWHFYENGMKTIFIIFGSFLTLRIIRHTKRFTMQKRNLFGFIITALVVHMAAPFFLHNKEIYFFAMPLPWTTTPIQFLYPKSSIYLSRFPVWGTAGITAALVFYLCVTIIVLVGTLLMGRRWQCSTLCLFNGFASEIFAPAFPLLGKAKKASRGTLKLFQIFRWVFLILALFFSLWWLFFLSGIPVFGNFRIISQLETIKYLSAELLLAMFFWIAWIGRGYCYYCPLGTVLALLSRWAGQKIITNRSRCIQCKRCDEVCPMTIDISSMAKQGVPVNDLRCVGCGHCIDACPAQTLGYSTYFLDWVYHHKR